jgi:hypothetical protein
MANIDISLAKHMLKLIDQPGGVRFNTNMISHDGMRDNISGSKKKQLKENEIMIIGTPGLPISIDDIITFLDKLEKHVSDSAFNSGRTYWFEGIYKEDGEYGISWGS